MTLSQEDGLMTQRGTRLLRNRRVQADRGST
jgi:hypothetical protein